MDLWPVNMKIDSNLNIAELRQLILAKQITVVELVTQYIDRIKQKNPSINAVTHLCEEPALLDARAADSALNAGKSIGPLHGIPFTLKDAFRVKGSLTTYGLPQYKKYQPQSESELVSRLRNAGAILIGRTNLPFASFDWQCWSPNAPECKNPWNTDHTPGGSSGGSAAAVAAGLSMFDIGSDLAGSIRYPAHCCGVFGFRPTVGAVPTADIGPEDMPPVFQSLVSCGPMARSIEDVLLTYKVIAGIDSSAARKEPKKTRLKIATVDSILGVQPSDAYRAKMELFLSKLKQDGHQIVHQITPDIDFEQCYRIWGMIVGYEYKKLLPSILRIWPFKVFFELYFLHLRVGYGPLTKYFKQGMRASESEYNNAIKERAEISKSVSSFFDDFDFWVLPSSPAPAIRRTMFGRFLKVGGEYKDYSTFLGSYLVPTAVFGTPVLNAPIGFVENMPVGAQIVGRPECDLDLLESCIAHISRHSKVQRPNKFKE